MESLIANASRAQFGDALLTPICFAVRVKGTVHSDWKGLTSLWYPIMRKSDVLRHGKRSRLSESALLRFVWIVNDPNQSTICTNSAAGFDCAQLVVLRYTFLPFATTVPHQEL